MRSLCGRESGALKKGKEVGSGRVQEMNGGIIRYNAIPSIKKGAHIGKICGQREKVSFFSIVHMCMQSHH